MFVLGFIAHSVLVLSNIPLSACTTVDCHSPTEGYIGCFQILAIMNKVAIHVKVFVWNVLNSFEKNTNRVAGSYGKSMFGFVRNPKTVFQSGHTNFQFHQQ